MSRPSFITAMRSPDARQRLHHVVRHEDRREVELPANPQERLLKPVARQRIEGAERLVEQHHERRGGERARHADALLLPARQLRGPPLPHDRAGASSTSSSSSSTRLRMRARSQPSSVSVTATFSATVMCGKSPMRWKTYPMRRRSSCASRAPGILPVDGDPPRARLDQPVHHLEGRGLARTRSAEQHQQLPLAHVKRQIVHGNDVRVALRQTNGLDHVPGVCAEPVVELPNDFRRRRAVKIAVVLFCALGVAPAYGQTAQIPPPTPPATDTVAPDIPGVVKGGTKVTVIKEGFQGTEGPIALPDGSLIFTETNASRITKIDSANNVTTFLENTNGSNGLAFDSKGRLLSVQTTPGRTRVGVIYPKGSEALLADGFEGRPNDLVVDKNGGVYFTVPVRSPPSPALRRRRP